MFIKIIFFKLEFFINFIGKNISMDTVQKQPTINQILLILISATFAYIILQLTLKTCPHLPEPFKMPLNFKKNIDKPYYKDHPLPSCWEIFGYFTHGFVFLIYILFDKISIQKFKIIVCHYIVSMNHFYFLVAVRQLLKNAYPTPRVSFKDICNPNDSGLCYPYPEYPDNERLVFLQWGMASFPSGHCARMIYQYCFLFSHTVIYLYPILVKRTNNFSFSLLFLIFVNLLSAATVIFVNTTRIIYNYHRDSEVIAGSLIGLVFGISYFYFARKYKKYYFDRSLKF